MKGFFEAKKIAVIGASRSKEKVGNVIFRNLLENKMLKVFPVNPNANYVEGREAYPFVGEIPFIIDLAIIVIPAEKVPEVLEQCGEKGIKKVIIISSGFSESDNLLLEDKVKDVAEDYGIKVLGPNVLGIINPYKNLNASFFKEMPEKGKVAFISQSGAVGTSLLDRALETKLGISGFVSLGNMLNEDFISALEYFGSDVYTETIALYIESLKPGTGRKFVELCKEIGKRKRIIAIKAGKTEEGLEAAETHTSSLSSPSAIYSGAFKQAGIIEVESLEEMFFLTTIFSKYPKLGKKVCIITNAGGLGVLAVDTLIKSGIEIPEIPKRVLEQLDSNLPEGYSRKNPLDILGDALALRYEKVLRILKIFKLFDFFVVIVSPQEMTQPEQTAQVLEKIGVPVFACFIGGKSFSLAKRYMLECGIINFDDVSELEILGKAS